MNDRETCFRRRRDWNDVGGEEVNFEQAKDKKKSNQGQINAKKKTDTRSTSKIDW